MKHINIGFELVSLVRCDKWPVKELPDILKDVADIGYDGVEFCRGLFGKTPQEISQVCKDLGLAPVSSHTEIEVMTADMDLALKESRGLGLKYIAFPNPGKDVEYHNAREEDLVMVIDRIRKYAQIITDNGFICAQHSSSVTFETDKDGKMLIDRIMEEIDPAILQIQLDSAWAMQADVDVPAYIRKYDGRLDVFHIKDFIGPMPRNPRMVDRKEATFAEKRDAAIGEGMLDIPGIVKACKETGVQWIHIEQMERVPYDVALDFAKRSYNNLVKAMEE